MASKIPTVDLAIVCPMANEGQEAVRFVSSVLHQCKGFRTVRFFAVLDRVSKDDTLALLQQMETEQPQLQVVWAPENRCVVDAYVRGYREALQSSAQWILEIDAGFSHQPEDIPKFFAAMEQGYDCVFGSRFMRGGTIVDSSMKRQALSRGGTLLTNLLLGTKLSDMTSGFQLFSRETLQMVLDRGICSRAHFFQTEMKTYCAQLRVTEVPIKYTAASPSVSQKAIKDSFKQLGRLVKLRYTGQLWPTSNAQAVLSAGCGSGGPLQPGER